MTFEDKLTLFLMIVAVFAVIIIIIVLVDMFLDAKTKKVIEIVETEKVVEKVVKEVVKEVVKPVPTKPQVVKTVKQVSPTVTVYKGDEAIVYINDNGVAKTPEVKKVTPVVKPNANTMPVIEVKQGNETLLCIDENGVVKQPKNQNVNVTINK